MDINVETFAGQVADFFRTKDYPFLGVEVNLGGTFPLVTLWDDDAQVTRVIACTADETQGAEALAYATTIAQQEETDGNAPCGAVGAMVWPGGWRIQE